MVTGNKKLINCDNILRRRSLGQSNEPPQTLSNAGLHPKTIMLSECWDFNRALLRGISIVIAEKLILLYITRSQIYAKNGKKRVSRKGVVFHKILTTRQKIFTRMFVPFSIFTGRGAIRLPLIPVLQNLLNRITFIDERDVKTHLEIFLADKLHSMKVELCSWWKDGKI